MLYNLRAIFVYLFILIVLTFEFILLSFQGIKLSKTLLIEGGS